MGNSESPSRSINHHPADPLQGHGRGLHPRDTVSSSLGGRRTIIRTIRNHRRLTATAVAMGRCDAPLSFHPHGRRGQRSPEKCSMKVVSSALARHSSRNLLIISHLHLHMIFFFPAFFRLLTQNTLVGI